jgi:hypothetical protein
VDLSEQLLLVFVLASVVVTVVGFVIGRRRNRALAIAVSRDLQVALSPTESTYTWIGGLIGFHARYAVAGCDQVKVTCTLLPRHSPLYMPLALLMGRGDRVHVTFYLIDGFDSEGHIVSASADRSPLLHIDGRESMRRRSSSSSDTRFVLLGTTDDALEAMAGLLSQIEQKGIAASVRHVAVVPGLSTLYVQVVPRPGVVRGICDLVLDRRKWIVERFATSVD